MNRKHPNLFIVGAPKCGTTSLAAWLSSHPEIFVCPNKEPEFFNTDMYLPNRYSLKEYELLFSDAPQNAKYSVDATANYLYSESAIPQILRYSPHSKFVVMVRNPVEMAVSLHGQKVREAIENEKDFSTAWGLQERRSRGVEVPRMCYEPKTLLYGQVCMVGMQIKRLFDLVSRERVFVQILDDLKTDPRGEYLRLLNFLELEDDGRSSFPVHNSALTLPKPIAAAVRHASELKRMLRIRGGLGVIAAAQSIFGQTPSERHLPDDMLKELRRFFKEDICILSDQLGVDLTPWLKGASLASRSNSVPPRSK